MWPDNWLPLMMFRALGTQWRMGMGGPVGLDYGVFPLIYRMHGVSRKDQPEMFECLRVMESEALSIMHRKE